MAARMAATEDAAMAVMEDAAVAAMEDAVVVVLAMEDAAAVVALDVAAAATEETTMADTRVMLRSKDLAIVVWEALEQTARSCYVCSLCCRE